MLVLHESQCVLSGVVGGDGTVKMAGSPPRVELVSRRRQPRRELCALLFVLLPLVHA